MFKLDLERLARVQSSFMCMIGLCSRGGLAFTQEVAEVSMTVKIGDITGPEGHWAVVVRGDVVASSEDLRKMLELAEKYPPEDTVVTKILYPQASFY